MTTFKEPFYIASAGSTDGNIFAVSGGGITIDGDLSTSSASFAGAVDITGALRTTGNFHAVGSALSVETSAIKLKVGTTAPAAQAVPTSVATWLKVNVNGTAYKVPLVPD